MNKWCKGLFNRGPKKHKQYTLFIVAFQKIPSRHFACLSNRRICDHQSKAFRRVEWKTNIVRKIRLLSVQHSLSVSLLERRILAFLKTSWCHSYGLKWPCLNVYHRQRREPRERHGPTTFPFRGDTYYFWFVPPAEAPSSEGTPSSPVHSSYVNRPLLTGEVRKRVPENGIASASVLDWIRQSSGLIDAAMFNFLRTDHCYSA